MERVGYHVELLNQSMSTQNIVAMAAKLCYSKATIDTLHERIENHDQEVFIAKLESMGHESPLEHVTFTFGIEGVSRAFLAQITRHRLASFSVQSQRYVRYENGFNYVVPEKIMKLGEDKVEAFCNQMQMMNDYYQYWLGLLGDDGAEDARFVLPQACETRMIVTMNVRELRHFFSLRMCRRAQWEIRQVADAMFKLVYDVVPCLFENAGPGCCGRGCPEGEKSCGSSRKQEIKELKERELT